MKLKRRVKGYILTTAKIYNITLGTVNLNALSTTLQTNYQLGWRIHEEICK